MQGKFRFDFYLTFFNRKLQMETRDNINDLTLAFERESEQLTNRVRELTSAAVNQQLSALTNIKARGKVGG